MQTNIDRGLELEIDESNLGGMKPPYVGLACYRIKSASYDPHSDDGHIYVLNLEMQSDVGDEYRSELKLKYWMDTSKDGVVTANNRTRAIIRDIGRIRFGPEYMKVPLPDDITGLIVMADVKLNKNGYPSVYDYSAPSADWVTACDGKNQYSSEGTLVG